MYANIYMAENGPLRVRAESSSLGTLLNCPWQLGIVVDK